MADRSVAVRLRLEAGQYLVNAKAVTRATRDMRTEVAQTARKHEQAFNDAGMAVGAFGAAAAVGVGMAVKSFMNFDKQMSAVQAATHASASVMDELRDAALEAGARTKYSATEAAAGVEELAKAGVATEDILNGGLNGALDLAAAGNFGVAESAEIAASAMVQFGLKGEDVTHIADLLAAGAGKAQGSVQDMGLALSYVGPVAGQMGISIEETAGAIALLAHNGITGEKAGTNLRGVLMSLTAPSIKAAEAMEKYGINVYDAQGSLLGFSGIAEELQVGLGGLDEATRNQALGQIFGNEQMTGAITLYKGGAEAVDQWKGKVDDAGYAQETAAIKMDNLAGDFEQLMGSLETALIKTGSAGDDFARGAVKNVTGVVNAYGSLPDPVQAATLKLGAVAAAVGIAGGGMLLLAPRIIEARSALRTLNTEMPKTSRLMRGIGTAAVAMTAVSVMGDLFSETADDLRRYSETVLAASHAGDDVDAQIDAISDAIAEQQAIVDDAALSWQFFGGGLYSNTQAADAADRVEHLENQLKELEHQKELDRIASEEAGTANAGMAGDITAAGDATEAASTQIGAASEAAGKYVEEMGLVGDEAAIVAGQLDATAERAGLTTEDFLSWRDELAGIIGSFAEPLAAYQTALEEKQTAAQSAAEKAAEVHNESIDARIQAAHRDHEARVESARQNGEVSDSAIRKMEEQRDATVQGLEDQRKSWEDYPTDVKVSVDEYLAELTRQVEAQAAWETNMLILSGQVSQGTLDELARMGPEGAPLVQALVDAGVGKTAEMDRLMNLNNQSNVDNMADIFTRAGPVLAHVLKVDGEKMVQALAAELEAGETTVEQIARNYGIALDGQVIPAANRADEAFGYLKDAVNQVPASVRIPVTAPGSGAAINNVDRLRRKVESLGDKTFDIRVGYAIASTGGRIPEARGGVLDFYADGGMRENHVAQIAPAGSWRVWAEPETGGEAYIPLAPAKRQRSTDIWRETGKRLGMPEVQQFADGGITERKIVATFRDSGLRESLAGLAQQIERGARSFAKAQATSGGGPVNPGLAGALSWARGEAGKPYIWGGVGPRGYDCSGFISAITNVITGRSPYSRLFATSSFAGGRSAGGYEPGLGGAMTLGTRTGSPGHMAGTLNGVNVESRGGEGVVVGSRARGSRDSMFTHRYSLRGYADGGIETPDGDPPFDYLNPSGMHYEPAARSVLENVGVFDRGGYLDDNSLAANYSGGEEFILNRGLTTLLRDVTPALDRLASQTFTPAAVLGSSAATSAQPSVVNVSARVFVGDREITDIVRVEVDESMAFTAGQVEYGRTGV